MSFHTSAQPTPLFTDLLPLLWEVSSRIKRLKVTMTAESLTYAFVSGTRETCPLIFFYCTYLIFLDEADEGGALDFDRLPCSVVHGDHKMEEIRLP